MSEWKIATTTKEATAKVYTEKAQAHMDVYLLNTGSVVPLGAGFAISFGPKKGYLVRAIGKYSGRTIQ
jgi:hypothetical protein